MAKRKGPICSRSQFPSQYEYEECLEQQREKRRTPNARTEADRLNEGFTLGEDDDVEVAEDE